MRLMGIIPMFSFYKLLRGVFCDGFGKRRHVPSPLALDGNGLAYKTTCWEKVHPPKPKSFEANLFPRFVRRSFVSLPNKVYNVDVAVRS